MAALPVFVGQGLYVTVVLSLVASFVSCRGALASSDLQPQQLLKLCQSLPLDILNDMPPALLLLLHEQQQEQNQQQHVVSSLLLALAAAMERHCSVSSGPPTSSPAAAAAPELAVAILHAETKILSQLRQVDRHLSLEAVGAATDRINDDCSTCVSSDHVSPAQQHLLPCLC